MTTVIGPNSIFLYVLFAFFRKILIALAYVFVLLMSINCSRPDNPTTAVPFYPVALTTVFIAKGNFTGGEQIAQQNTTYTDSTHWNALLSAIDPYRLAQFTETYQVDFTQFQIVAVIDQVYPSPTYTVTINTVTERADRIEVRYQKMYKPSIATITAQSYHMLKIPRSAKPVVFVLE